MGIFKSKPDASTCYNCGHLYRREGKVVETGRLYNHEDPTFVLEAIVHYCKMCAPAYDRVVYGHRKATYWKNIGWVQCDEEGDVLP